MEANFEEIEAIAGATAQKIASPGNPYFMRVPGHLEFSLGAFMVVSPMKLPFCRRALDQSGGFAAWCSHCLSCKGCNDGQKGIALNLSAVFCAVRLPVDCFSASMRTTTASSGSAVTRRLDFL